MQLLTLCIISNFIVSRIDLLTDFSALYYGSDKVTVFLYHEIGTLESLKIMISGSSHRESSIATTVSRKKAPFFICANLLSYHDEFVRPVLPQLDHPRTETRSDSRLLLKSPFHDSNFPTVKLFTSLAVNIFSNQ